MIRTEGKSNQEIVDEIFEVLVKQGKRCMKNGVCAHADGEGNHCAFGLLLDPANKEIMRFDEDSLSTVIKFPDNLGPNSKFINSNLEMISILQEIHDAEHHDHSGFRLSLLSKKFNIKSEWADKWVAMRFG